MSANERFSKQKDKKKGSVESDGVLWGRQK